MQSKTKLLSLKHTKLSHIKKKEEDLFGYILKHMPDKALAVAKDLKNLLKEKQSQGVNDGALIHSSTYG